LNNLPTQTPAEILAISPESLEVANSYLQSQSIQKVAEELGISTELVTQELNRREVRAYIDSVFLDVGFNNRFKMRVAMDALIQQKFMELEEAGIGSSKDIADLLALSHKMTMEQLDRQIKLEEIKNKNINNQVNVQVNEFGNNTKYGNLISQLLQQPKAQ
jgi:hypothetical protein